MGNAKRQRTAQYHMEQTRFKLSEDAMNASEAARLERLKKSGLVKEEVNDQRREK